MKQIILLIFISLIIPFSFAQKAQLVLKVDNIETAEGKICISIFNNEDDYKDGENQVWTDCVDVVSEKFEHIIPDLPHDNYVISIYHDKNSNGEFDTKWYGMPKEAFGFSNNAKGKMGPPKFEDAMFEVQQDTEVVIHLMKL